MYGTPSGRGTTDIVEHENGMQKYLGYCKRNGITEEKIEKEVMAILAWM